MIDISTKAWMLLKIHAQQNYYDTENFNNNRNCKEFLSWVTENLLLNLKDRKLEIKLVLNWIYDWYYSTLISIQN